MDAEAAQCSVVFEYADAVVVDDNLPGDVAVHPFCMVDNNVIDQLGHHTMRQFLCVSVSFPERLSSRQHLSRSFVK